MADDAQEGVYLQPTVSYRSWGAAPREAGMVGRADIPAQSLAFSGHIFTNGSGGGAT